MRKQLVTIKIMVLLFMWCTAAKSQIPILKQKKPDTATEQLVDFTGAFHFGFFGDHDGDGDLDYIGPTNPYEGVQKFFVQENDGNGNFSAVKKASFHTDKIGRRGGAEREYALGDFNGDNHQDLLAIPGIAPTDSTQLFWGAADGSMTFSGIHLQSCYDGQIIPVDVDSDGDLDVFLAGQQRAHVMDLYTYKTIVYLNDGSGNFTEGLVVESEDNAEIVITEPFSGTKRNLFIRSRFSGSYQTHLYHYDGAGNFSFINGGITDATGVDHELHVADVNGDGIGDLLNESSFQGLNFFVSTSETSYDHLTTSNMHQHGKNDNFQEMLFGDLNLDGYADLIYTPGYNGSSVYHGDGSGDFTLVESFIDTESVASYTIGDITGDGYPEFMELGSLPLSDAEPKGFSGPNGEVARLFINGGDGTFTPVENSIVKNTYKGMIGVTDVDGDCDRDLIVLGEQHDNETEGDLYLQDASGQFINSTSVDLDLSKPSLIADLNNDGSAEILSGGKVYTYDGSGYIQNNNYAFASIDEGVIYQFDANGDNALDVLISGGGSTVLHINYGDGNYERLNNFGISGLHGSGVAAGDLDNDGDNDLIVTGTLNNNEIITRLYLNNGDGYFTESVETGLPDITNGGVSLLDLNADGALDVVLAGSGVFATYLNDGTGKSFTEYQSFDGFSKATLKSFDVDYDGDIDFVASGFSEDLQWATTQLYLNDGSGNFSKSDVNLRGAENATLTFEDIDDDYDADFLMVGNEESNNYWYVLISRIYENTATVPVINKEVTVCDSYCFRGTTLTSSGSYSETFTTAEGETRTVNLELTVAGAYNETVNVSADGSYRFNSKILRESGTYTATLTSSQGCDSLVTLNLTIADHVSPSDVEQIAYYLMQPNGTPQVQADFKATRHGTSIIYDMDGDGDNDHLVVAQNVNYKSQFVSYLNQGNGSFARVDYPDLSLSFKEGTPILLHGDLNGDGFEDLIVSGERYEGGGHSPADLGTQVYFGDASGGLNLQSDISMQSPYYGFITLADLTGDDKLDVLLGRYPEGTFLYVNDGGGAFTETVPSDIEFNLISWDAVVSKSYNGVKDVLLGSWTDGYKLYRNDGTNFTHVTDIAGDDGYKAHFADANNDGAPDILIGSTSSVKIYLNDGSGNYAENTAEDFDNIKTYNNVMRFEDLNNDNAAEVIFDKSKNGTDVFVVFWNDGSGNFPTNTQYASSNLNYSSFAIGDLTGDTYPDIFFSGEDYLRSDLWETGGYINNQSGGFDEIVYGVIDNIQNGATQYADIDGDGDADLITSGKSFELDAVTSIYLNDGTGEFAPVASHALDSVEYASIDLADIDGNETNDLVISGIHRTGKLITKVYNNTSGSFAENTSLVMDSVAQGVVKFFHANDDSHLDILSIGKDKFDEVKAFVYTGDGTGGFTAVASGLEGLSNPSVAIADLNGDNFEDILMVGKNDVNDNVVRFYLGNGDATFTLNTSNAFVGASDVQIADIDGDGIEDVYLAGVSVQAMYLNDGAGQFSLLSYLEEVTNSKAQFDDVDLDGDQDFIVSGDWINQPERERTYLYVNDGSGNFSRTGSNILHDVEHASMHLADVDGDYDKDLVLSGTVTVTAGVATSSTRLYRNVSCVTNLVVLDPVSSCDTYDFYGQTLGSSGIYTHNISGIDGCNRTLLLEFTMLKDEVTITEEACESYTFDGKLLTVSDTYSATFTNTFGCDSVVRLELTIMEIPLATIEQKGVVLFANDINSAAYQWYNCDTDEPIAGEDKRQLTPPMTGNYYVEVTNGSCSSNSECLFFDWVLETQATELSQLLVYPTLTHGEITVAAQRSLPNAEVRLLSLNGTVVLSKHFNVLSEATLQIQEPTGIYLLQIVSEGTIINTQRILKK